MWCTCCQQDVPAHPDADQQHLCCSRCGEPVSGSTPAADLVEAELVSQVELDHDDELADLRLVDPHLAAPFDTDTFDERLSEAKWKLQRVVPLAEPVSFSGEIPRFDESASWTFAPQYSRRTLPEASPPASEPSGSNPAGWSVLVLGIAIFVCGAVLLGWSYWGDRPELWGLGVPITLAGQAGLLLGLVMLLERLSRENRTTADQLHQLDERLHEVRPGSPFELPHPPTGQAFYTHLAEGAKPEMLLNDLRRQLDLLAVRLSDRK